MTKTIIFAISAIIASLTLTGSVLALEHDTMSQNKQSAIPEWVKNQFSWYVNGEIDEKTLLTSMNWMFDNNLMHLSEKAAKEVNELKETNKKLRHGIGVYISQGHIDEDDFESISDIDVEPSTAAIAIPNLLDARKGANESTSETGVDLHLKAGDSSMTKEQQEALTHLKKAYDLNPNLKTKIIQYDKDHDKWIDVLSIDYGKMMPTDSDACPLVYDPVCGTDGKTYSNECKAELANIATQYEGECKDTPACPLVYDPVCGTDGKTYSNECKAELANIATQYEGECKDTPACPLVYDPVCGTDGKTYSNECKAELANIATQYEGECKDTPACPLVYDPVCGTDGKTYSNECEATKAEVDISHEGECVVCPKNYEPVCGDDGNTYSNKCEASKAGVNISYENVCRQP